MRKWVVLALGVLGLLAGCAGVDKDAGASRYPEQETQALLSKMTLEEKVGQMTQVTLALVTTRKAGGSVQINARKLKEALLTYHVGSILSGGDQAVSPEIWHALITQTQDLAVKESRLGIPVIFGIDSVRAGNHITGSTRFPQNIALGATGNRELVRCCAEVTALETRAAGISWILSPVLGLARQPLGLRFSETYGEDTHMVSVLGSAHIMGLQGTDSSDSGTVAGCMKFYPGCGAARSGQDQTPVHITEHQLRERVLPPFAAAVKAGVLTAWVNSSGPNGSSVPASAVHLQELLRQELGFKGLVVSDWNGINNLHERETVAQDQREAVKSAVMAGIDMCTGPDGYLFHRHLMDLVKSGDVPVRRIDEAVGRILRVKYQLELFEKPYPDKTLAGQIGSKESAELNYQAACEALTLLKNKRKILPLSLDIKVLVTGPCANRLSVLSGACPRAQEDAQKELFPSEKDSILEAIEKKLGSERVTSVDTSFDELGDLQTLVQRARSVDVVIACVGEPSHYGMPGDGDDPNLCASQMKLVGALAQAGKPVIGVLVQDRPRVIRQIEDKLDAIVLAYRPGMEGGRALADALFGVVNPSGKLPFTYPRHANGHICYDHRSDEEAGFDPQWEFGHGLSYTGFAYRGLRTDKDELSQGDSVKVTVEVVNTGKRAGKEIVRVFLTDHVASVPPAVRRLKGFTKIDLEPGQSEYVSITLDWDDFGLIGPDNQPVVEPGEFTVSVGGLSQTVTVLLETKAQR